MDTWSTLVASALVGTSRQEPSIDLTHPALSDYAASLQTQSVTQQVLGAAGLVATYQAVGKSAELASLPLLPPAAGANLPCCSISTTQYLNAVLHESKYEPILPELLQLLVETKQTVPPDFLPLLLNLGKRERKLRGLILPILGSRGQWLVRQNPDWKYAIGAAIESPDLAQLQELWATGTRHERLAAITQWRQLQATESRQAIVANWKQDKADDRQAWLEVLQTNLSLDDEEFLEVALFDRSEPVREKAAHLLNYLPSQYRQRLTKLASNCLTIKEKNNKYKIEVNLPITGDEEWQKAGVNTKFIWQNSRGGTIPEAMLFQALSAADLDIWGGDIDRLVQTASTLPQKHPILAAWARAASAQQRLDWIEVLLTRSHPFLTPNDFSQLIQSFQTTGIDRVEQFFINILTADNFVEQMDRNLEIIMTPVSSENRNWSQKFSDLVVKQFDRYIHELSKTGLTYYFRQEHLCKLLGQYLDVSVLPDLQQRQSKLSIENFNYTNCIELLEFRRDMRSTFNSPI